MKKKSVKIKRLSMDELATNAEKVLKGKEINKNGKILFERTLKKAVKQHSPK